MSTAVDLPKAIVDKLNDTANSFSLAFEAKRRAVPFLPQDKEIKQLQVAVFAGSKSSGINERGGNLKAYKPVIHVIKQLSSGDDAVRLEEVDQLIELVGEIESVAGTDLAGCGFMRFDEEQERDAYNAELLKAGCFSVPIVLEFWGP
jgi:hypothetical protein